MSAWALVRLARSATPRRRGTTMSANNPMIKITTMISIRVKPSSPLNLLFIAAYRLLHDLVELENRQKNRNHHEHDNSRHHQRHHGLKNGGDLAQRMRDFALIVVGDPFQHPLQLARAFPHPDHLDQHWRKQFALREGLRHAVALANFLAAFFNRLTQQAIVDDRFYRV